MKKTYSTRQGGFTFIEVLLVLAMGAFVLAAAPFYSRFILQNATLDAVNNLTVNLRKAELYAMMGKQNGNWGVNYSNNTITVYLGNSFGSRTAAFDEATPVNSNVNINGFTDINFTKGTGLPKLTPTITISSAGGNSKTVTVNSEGMITK